jgi:endoglucanase
MRLRFRQRPWRAAAVFAAGGLFLPSLVLGNTQQKGGTARHGPPQPVGLAGQIGLKGLPAVTPLVDQLFVDPASEAASWVRSHPGDARADAIQALVANRPTGKWFGAWSGDIASAVSSYTVAAAQLHRIPILVAYNIPQRDCGSQSAGGLNDEKAYNHWIDAFASGLSNRRALVILEPDALAELTNCLDQNGQQARLRMLSYAVNTLQTNNVWVYLDAGHSNWVPPDQMGQRLRAANVEKAHGFALNVSNYMPMQQEVAYANEVRRQLGMSKPFVIDTSRNGAGSANGQWCNPPGQRLGPPPRLDDRAEMLLWIKAPGESDGNCGIGSGTAAGQFSPTIASQLITGT